VANCTGKRRIKGGKFPTATKGFQNKQTLNAHSIKDILVGGALGGSAATTQEKHKYYSMLLMVLAPAAGIEPATN
jgi:hypothetical protein